MKRIQKMLMGIAISVFGGTLALGGGFFWYIGCAVSLIGLLYAFYGFYLSNDED